MVSMEENCLRRRWLFKEIQKAEKILEAEKILPKPPGGINPHRWEALIKSYHYGNLKEDNHQNEN